MNKVHNRSKIIFQSGDKEPEVIEQKEKNSEITNIDFDAYLKTMDNKKLLYSINEIAEMLSLSYEFIRSRVDCGKIKSKKFGDRKMIPINEVIRILENGVD